MTAALLNPSLALQSRVSIPAPGARLSADLFQPATPAGWAMPTYRPGDPLERFFLGRGGPPGARCRLGSAGLETAPAGLAPTTEQLRAATLWLRAQPAAGGLPLGLIT